MKNLYIKSLVFTGLLSAVTLMASAQNTGLKIGTNPTSKAPSAVLEVESINKGVLLPRVALTSTIDVVTVAAPANALTVFNTNTTTSGTNDVSPGYYYWSSADSRWFTVNGSDKALKSFLNYNGSSSFSLLNLTLLGGYRAVSFPASGKEFDENNEYNANTGIFTAKQDGIYNIFIQADSKGLVSAAEFGVGIFKIPAASSTPTLLAEERFLSVNVKVLVIDLDVSPPTRSTQTLVKLNAGDKIQFGVKLPLVTLSLLGSTQSYFTIHQVK